MHSGQMNLGEDTSDENNSDKKKLFLERIKEYVSYVSKEIKKQEEIFPDHEFKDPHSYTYPENCNSWNCLMSESADSYSIKNDTCNIDDLKYWIKDFITNEFKRDWMEYVVDELQDLMTDEDYEYDFDEMEGHYYYPY